MNRTYLNEPTVLVASALFFCLAGNALAQSSGEQPYWALEGGGGAIIAVSTIVNAEQNRFNVDASGPMFDVGLARMHGNGYPSFSLSFTRVSFTGNATGTSNQEFAGYKYQGSAEEPGFMATKYFNFVTFSHFDAGIGLGGGVGPQLSGPYKVTAPNGMARSRTYTLTQLSVTPLFAVTFRADIRITKQFSIGPYAGIEDALPVVGGLVRVGFTR